MKPQTYAERQENRIEKRFFIHRILPSLLVIGPQFQTYQPHNCLLVRKGGSTLSKRDSFGNEKTKATESAIWKKTKIPRRQRSPVIPSCAFSSQHLHCLNRMRFLRRRHLRNLHRNQHNCCHRNSSCARDLVECALALRELVCRSVDR